MKRRIFTVLLVQQKTYRLNPSLRQRCALQPPSKGIVSSAMAVLPRYD
jgi:hypothetical protein